MPNSFFHGSPPPVWARDHGSAGNPHMTTAARQAAFGFSAGTPVVLDEKSLQRFSVFLTQTFTNGPIRFESYPGWPGAEVICAAYLDCFKARTITLLRTSSGNYCQASSGSLQDLVQSVLDNVLPFNSSEWKFWKKSKPELVKYISETLTTLCTEQFFREQEQALPVSFTVQDIQLIARVLGDAVGQELSFELMDDTRIAVVTRFQDKLRNLDPNQALNVLGKISSIKGAT